VTIWSLMETSTSKSSRHQVMATTNKTMQQQRDRQVREGVEGGRLKEDGDININIDIERSVSPRRHRLLQCEPHSGGRCKQLQRLR
jgi:hypothetical protein